MGQRSDHLIALLLKAPDAARDGIETGAHPYSTSIAGRSSNARVEEWRTIHDLLNQAIHLLHPEPENQANLRRAVSAAYYAVFHLPIAEATANWNHAPLRTALGRAYDHGPMRTASNRILNTQEFPYTGEDPQVVKDLRFTARTFIQLQEGRHFADYNLTKTLDATDARERVIAAQWVFQIWPSIRDHQITQEYLVSLLVKR